MKKVFALMIALGFGLSLQAQERGYFYGDFQSNSQWLQSDSELGFEAPNAKFRANNYFRLNYSYGNFTAGIQYESYLPEAMLGYDPIFNGENKVATYYVNYRTNDLDITAGYFYDQFGSGLIFRSYENRQLGINNAIRGVRVKFTPTDFITLKGIYGEQRHGFELSDGLVQGLDADIDLGQMLNLGDWFVEVGGSYVGRYQAEELADTLPNTVNAYAARLNISKGRFYGGVEYVQLGKRALVNEEKIENSRLFDGNALQVNLGYAQSGFSINGTFRRMDNFSFYSDRMAQGNQYNQQLINYVPALTKKQDYLLANIYVYQAQPRLYFSNDPNGGLKPRTGEIGMQWDAFYTAEKGTALGGKYGTQISANFSYWGGLDTEFNYANHTYDAEFIGSGPRYYRDVNLEVKKRWSERFSSIFTYINQVIDKSITEGGIPGTQGDIKAQIGVIEGTYLFNDGRSVKLALQHLWTKQDRKNWAGGLLEFYYDSNLSVFVADSWNYGGEKELHYYSVGAGYSKGRTRLSLRYGRQRGGLLCVGGVCRYVPSSTGFTMNLAVSF